MWFLQRLLIFKFVQCSPIFCSGVAKIECTRSPYNVSEMRSIFSALLIIDTAPTDNPKIEFWLRRGCVLLFRTWGSYYRCTFVLLCSDVLSSTHKRRFEYCEHRVSRLNKPRKDYYSNDLDVYTEHCSKENESSFIFDSQSEQSFLEMSLVRTDFWILSYLWVKDISQINMFISWRWTARFWVLNSF